MGETPEYNHVPLFLIHAYAAMLNLQGEGYNRPKSLENFKAFLGYHYPGSAELFQFQAYANRL
jgi:hypothetical protein